MNPIQPGIPLLEGQPNFRDLGGYMTKEGQKIKRNLIFRSGSLSDITVRDIRFLEQSGLSMIIDFRSDREVERHPSPKIHTVTQSVRIPIVDAARDVAMEYLERNNVEGLKTLLIRDYVRLVTDHQPEFREFFTVLRKTESLPLVFHCAAGKDRTGLAAFFLLSALGVDPDTAAGDYFLTNHYGATYAEKIVRRMNDSGMNGEIIRPLMEVRQEYLDAALSVINERYGGVEKYLRDALGADVEGLKKRYLEG